MSKPSSTPKLLEAPPAYKDLCPKLWCALGYPGERRPIVIGSRWTEWPWQNVACILDRVASSGWKRFHLDLFLVPDVNPLECA